MDTASSDPIPQPATSSRWLIWPAQDNIAEFVSLCRKIANPDPVLHVCRGETLQVFVKDHHELDLAEEALRGLRARFHLGRPAYSF